MTTKQRLSATVDADVLRLEHEERMRALDEFIADYESEHGAIKDEDIRDASRRATARAAVVRGAVAAV